MEIVQWPDRVAVAVREGRPVADVWLDGRERPLHDYGIQGISIGRLRGQTLIVVTTHYLFEVTGFDDYNGIPSSQLKKVTRALLARGK